MRRDRLRTAALLSAMACLGLGLQLPAGAAGDTGMHVVAEVRGVPADTAAPPALIADGPGGVGYVLSGSTLNEWQRVQAVGLRSARALSPVTGIPPLENRAPVLVDTQHHVLMYAEEPSGLASSPAARPPVAPTIVGIGLRNGAVRVLFRVQTRFSPGARIAALALDDAGQDVLALASTEPSTTSEPGPTPSMVVHLDRLSLDGLVHATSKPRWAKPYQLPNGRCGAMIDARQPAALLVVGNRVLFGCGTARSTSGEAGNYSDRGSGAFPPGVVALSGVTTAANPAINLAFHRLPGEVSTGVTVADRTTRRFVVVTTLTNGFLMRVFDSDHDRWVGAVKADGLPFGFTTNPKTGRLYFAGSGIGFGSFGRTELASLVPTQGATQNDPFVGMLRADNLSRRLTYDGTTDRLFLPRLDDSRSPKAYSILIVRDNLPRFTAPPVPDPDDGALDTVDRAGVTDSNRSASGRAYGADYQLVGGATNLYQNLAADNGTALRPGTRALRQGYVKQAGLGSDGSTAVAVSAEEDTATDADRGSAGAGNQFAVPALCSDFGTSPTKKPITVPTAQVTCDLEQERTHATATYHADEAVLLTTQGSTSPVPAPVQVGDSSADVKLERAAGRGPLHTTLTATADNISILGLAKMARVTSTVSISTNGRSGTAVAGRPVVSMSGVEVGGAPVCHTECSPTAVAAAINKALDGRGWVEFPTAAVLRSRHGSTVRVSQDPWYHAERVLDYDNADDDFLMPAMTIVMNLDRAAKSRLVVDLAAVSTDASYRIFALDKFTGDAPGTASGPSGAVLLSRPTGTVGAPVTDTGGTGGTAVAAPAGTSQEGVLANVAHGLRLALRSPAAALPLLLIWALLALPEYLAARRRLLLELPMLTREQDVA
jgi:hypothetical protein